LFFQQITVLIDLWTGFWFPVSVNAALFHSYRQTFLSLNLESVYCVLVAAITSR